jgi:hypothetical protein
VFTVVVRVASAPDTVLSVELSVLSVPERDEIFTVFCVTFALVVARFPERVFMVVVSVLRFPERVAIFAFIPAIVPERAFCARVSVK